MNRYSHRKIASIVIHFKFRKRRSIFTERFYCIRETGVPALNKLQFLEKVAYSAVTVYSCTNIILRNAFIRNTPVEAGETGYFNTLRGDSDSYRLVYLIGTVINRIGKDFFYRRIGVICYP